MKKVLLFTVSLLLSVASIYAQQTLSDPIVEDFDVPWPADVPTKPGSMLVARVTSTTGGEFELWVNGLSAGAIDASGRYSKFFTSTPLSCKHNGIQNDFENPKLGNVAIHSNPQGATGVRTMIVNMPTKGTGMCSITLGDLSCINESNVWTSSTSGEIVVELELVDIYNPALVKDRKIVRFPTNPNHPWYLNKFKDVAFSMNTLYGKFTK